MRIFTLLFVLSAVMLGCAHRDQPQFTQVSVTATQRVDRLFFALARGDISEQREAIDQLYNFVTWPGGSSESEERRLFDAVRYSGFSGRDSRAVFLQAIENMTATEKKTELRRKAWKVFCTVQPDCGYSGYDDWASWWRAEEKERLRKLFNLPHE